MLTNSAACQGASPQCQMKRMVPSAELLGFLSFFFVFAFSTIVGEDRSREELENTPSGEIAKFTKFGWFECQGERVKKQVDECLGIECHFKNVFPAPAHFFWFAFFSVSGSVRNE